MVKYTNGLSITEKLNTLSDYMSGEKSVNYRLGTSNQFRVFNLTSTKQIINDLVFRANEYGVPIGGIDLTLPTSATTLGIASTSVNDTSAGTGARTLLITGLNSNYDEIQEVVTLNGQTEVNTTASFLRVNGANVLTTGSVGFNQGTIYIGGSVNVFTAGVPNTNIFRTIGVDTIDSKGLNISLNSTFTIPRGWEAVALNFKINTDATDAKPLLVRGILKPFGLPELTIGNLVFNGAPEYTFDGFPKVDEKTDLIVRVAKKTANQVDRAVVYWEFVARKKEYIV